MTHDPLCPTQTTNGETMSIPNALPTLSAGVHRPDEGKACVMEYVALLAGEEWTDAPACTHPALARAAQVVNDRLADEDRHLLVPLIGRLFGTDIPVDDRLFALRIARTVEHLSSAAKACNDVTERYIAGEATVEDLKYAFASDAAFAAAARAARAAAASDAATHVAWMASVIDIYDDLAGRTSSRVLTDDELASLAAAVAR